LLRRLLRRMPAAPLAGSATVGRSLSAVARKTIAQALPIYSISKICLDNLRFSLIPLAIHVTPELRRGFSGRGRRVRF